MHYGGSKPVCQKGSSPYMTLKSGKEIPNNTELSSIDIKILKELYAPPKQRNEFLTFVLFSGAIVPKVDFFHFFGNIFQGQKFWLKL